MTKASTEAETYVSQFRSFQYGIGGAGPGWLRRAREEGISRFASKGFPTVRDEDWKYTRVTRIARASFTPAWDLGNGRRPVADTADHTLGWPGWGSLLFVNGAHAPDLSSKPELPDGVRATSLAEAIAENSDHVRGRLGKHASSESNPFVALNTAFIRDGGLIYVPDGTVLETPISLVFLSGVGQEAIVCHPRNLIVLGEGASASVIESYSGPSGGRSFTNAVTEVVLGPGARLDYYKLQSESEESYHVSTIQVYQGQDSRFTSFYLDLGARIARNDLNVTLAGEGSSCTLDGLYIAGGKQHIDNHTSVDHQNSFTSSRQVYKGVMEGHSRAVFNGKVIARRGTHQVDAQQANNNLLLSEDSEVNTKPQLEIFADDLKCSHGATVGQLDEEAIFYMKARGIGHEEARRFLTYGFALDVVARVESNEVRGLLEQMVQRRLQVDSATHVA